MGEKVPDEGGVRALFDDSIIQDTEAEKTRGMKEIAIGLQMPWECRVRWYGEDEAAARRNSAGAVSRAAEGLAAGRGAALGGARPVAVSAAPGDRAGASEAARDPLAGVGARLGASSAMR